MNEAVLALLFITALFGVLLVTKTASGWRFCVICTSVSITWVVLLVLYWLGRFEQPLIIAVLMGQSIVGGYYFLEKRTDEYWHLFRLPVLLTLTLAALAALGTDVDVPWALSLLALLWAGLSLLFLYRQHPKTRAVVDRIIACCKDW